MKRVGILLLLFIFVFGFLMFACSGEVGKKNDNRIGEKEETAKEEKVIKEAGQSITISGTITYDGYTQGEIFIGAYEEKYLMPPGSTAGVEPLQESIGAVSIQAPGAYSFQVPANSGEVWIAAINDENNNKVLEVDMEPAGKYTDNPLIIGTDDIKDVNITLKPGGLF